MRHIYYLFLLAAVAFGCYDDKGNYDYAELAEVSIELPAASYSRQVGESLQITPVVTTDIPESDLAYTWEFEVDTMDVWYDYYISVYEGKNLDYVMDADLFTEGTYNLRLNVSQTSTGRHFYSEEVAVTVTTEPSHLGLMVLHGDGTSTDIGIIVAEEFYWSAPTEETEELVLPAYYSEANGGEKMTGIGRQVLQAYVGWGSADYRYIIALTDESSTVAAPKTMEKEGEWNDLFAGNLNKGNPRAVLVNSNLYAFDGDDIFSKQGYSYRFTTPLYERGFSDEGDYDFYPWMWFPVGYASSFQAVLFDEATRGFVGVGQIYDFSNLVPINALEEGAVTGLPFNPADMQADLVFMSGGGGTGHLIAVMRDDAGTYFLAELDPSNASANVDVPQFKYDLSGWNEVQAGQAIDWAFADGYMNMCFYATANGVYQFAVDNGTAITPVALQTQDNSPLEFEGEITMMKLLDPTINGGGYYMTDTEMVVATYGGTPGTGILYSMELEPFSGRVISVKEYTGFDEIYDVDLKAY